MILDLCFLAFVSVWSIAIGLFILFRLIEVPREPADALALAIPLGLGVLSWCVLVLGCFGWLGTWQIGAILAGGVLVTSLSWRSFFSLAHSWWCHFSSVRDTAEIAGTATIDRVVGGIFVLILLGTLFTALQPVTDGDALCYHLQVPKMFLAQGRLLYDQDLHETVYPLVAELLNAVGLALRGPSASRLISWLLGVALGLGTTALARPILGRRAWWAGTMILGVPAVSNGMCAALNDVPLAACGVASLLAWMEWQRTQQRGALILSGLLCGVALGVKYPALVWSGVLIAATGLTVLATGTDAWWKRLRSAVTGMSWFAVVALLAGGIWYARAWWHTGNPVHPFFREIFGSGLEEVLEPAKRPLAATPWNILIALGVMTIDPARFDSVPHQLGPVFLLLLPGVLMMRPPRAIWQILALGFAFFALCLTQRQSMRFILICLGPFSVVSAWVLNEWRRRQGIAPQCMLGLVIVILIGEGGLALARGRHGWRTPLGLESAESYLERREPTWIVGRWVAAHLPRDARVIGQDHRGFYLPCSYTMELAHRRRTGLGSQAEPPQQLVDKLRARGFTHVLFCPPEPEDAVEYDPTLTRLLEPWLLGRQPLYQARLTDGDGVLRRYSLYDLAEQSADLAQTRSESSGGNRR
jgi:hypothetical protein